MKKVSELEGAELDYWVAKAEGLDPDVVAGGFTPSSRWHDGGPIIERELIELAHDRAWREDGSFGRVWEAHALIGYWGGDTPLIAAMRAYVASKFGEEVPE